MDSIEQAIVKVLEDHLVNYVARKKRLLTVAEAAEYLAVSQGAIYNLIAEEKLIPTRFNRKPLLDIEDLNRLIQESKKA